MEGDPTHQQNDLRFKTNMNKSITSFVKSVFAGITFIAMSAAVQAAPISYTYSSSAPIDKTLQATWGFFSTIPDTYQLGYDLSSGSWSTEGYDPSTDTLSNLDITLRFSYAVFAPLWSLTTSFGDLAHTASSIWTNTTTFSLTNIDLDAFEGYNLGSDIELAFNNTLLSATLTGYTLTFSGTRELAQQAVPVPTPSTLALLSVGLLGAGWFSRRRNETAHS